MRKLSQTRNKKAQKESLFTEELIEALNKEDKSEEDVEIIRRKTANLSFFSGYYEEKLGDLHKQACYKFKHEFMKKGTTVFKIFSQSEKFYILLSGILEMYGQKPSDEEEVEKDYEQTASQNESNIQSNPNNNSNNTNNNQSKNEKKDIVLYLQKILKPGSCFGEIGLICNKSRTATINCSEDSHFAVLEKQDFVQTLKPTEEKKLMKQTEFLGSLPCFNGWPFHFLRDIHLNITKRQLNKGDYVFKEGDKSTFVAIVMRGKFVVYKEFMVQKPQITEEKVTELNQTTATIQQNERIPKKKKQDIIISKQPFNINECSLKSKKEIKKIFELGEKDLFGEEDVVKNRKRQYSVKCENCDGGEIILITKQVFRERIICREIASRTITSRIPLKEQLFADHVQLIETNLKNFKRLLRENRAELISDKLKEQRLQQEQQQYYKKYFSNQAQVVLSKDNSFEVISSNNKIQDNIQNLNSEFLVNSVYLNNGNMSFSKMNEAAINQSQKYSSPNQSPSSSQMKRRNSANTPIHIIQERESSPSQLKNNHQRQNTPNLQGDKKNIADLPNIPLIDSNLIIPSLIGKANEIVNKNNDKKLVQNIENEMEEEFEFYSGQNTYRSSVYNRKNLMMDEKGNGIPLIDPMKNEEELDRQVRKLLQKSTKRKNYLGDWRNGINQMDKVYGVLRNAGYFDQKLQEIQISKHYKQSSSPRDFNSSLIDSVRNNQSRKAQSHLNSSLVDSPQLQEITKIDQEQQQHQQQSLQQLQNENEQNPSSIMDYYLNQSNLYSIGYNEDVESMINQKEIAKHQIISSNIYPNSNQRKYVPPLSLQNKNLSLQNRQYQGGSCVIKSSGDENGSTLNYPLKGNKYSKWQLSNKTSLTLSQIQTKQQNTMNEYHSILSNREQGYSTRKSMNNNSNINYRSALHSANNNSEQRCLSMRGHIKETNSPFNRNILNQPHSARQQRSQLRTPSQLIQDLSRPLTRNKLLKSSTPIDFNEKNASMLLEEGLKENIPKPFKEFNPTQKPLSMNQQEQRIEEAMNLQDPYFQNSQNKDSLKRGGYNNRYKVKQTINQFINRHTQKQKLLITDDINNSQNNQNNPISEDLIDFSKIYLSKIQKHSNKSKDPSYHQKQRSLFI